MSEEIKIPVKLFISKFPQTLSEDELREVFSEFGEIESLVILKTKDVTRSQGCGFVRFKSVSDASRAIHELNGKRVIDPVIGALNVEYAAGEADRLNIPASAEGTSVKLFVGGVPLEMTETELCEYFGEFGNVIECHSLPPKTNNPNINTKAAFVRFARRSEALAAIEACDRKRNFHGIERPMDVRIAEGKPAMDKPFITDNTPGQYRGGGGYQHSGYPMPGHGPSNSMHATHLPHPYMQSAASPPVQHHQPPVRPPGGPPRTIGGWTEYFSAEGRPYFHNSATNITTWDAPVEFRMAAASPPPTYSPVQAPPRYQTPMYTSQPGAGGVDVKGPPGANLFVFHVPPEWTDSELQNQFSRFGHVLSSRIARDKDTNRPKGFGFVSFDNPNAATAAVHGMNGMMVSSGKRLKVSVKRGEEFGANGMQGPLHAAPAYPY